jgi:hypothetical protein
MGDYLPASGKALFSAIRIGVIQRRRRPLDSFVVEWVSLKSRFALDEKIGELGAAT